MKQSHYVVNGFMWLMLAFSTLFVAATSFAEEMPAPQALVKTASDEMLAALKTNKEDIEADSTKIYPLVENILLPHFDFEKMSKLALGKNWRVATDAQQARFIEEFRLLLVRTYATALLEYSNEEIRMLPFRDDVSTKRVTVPMEVVQPAGPAIPMALSLYETDDMSWKVYDVKIDGISLVTNYRSSFATEIRQGGMDKLIESLAERNAKVKA
jgi:phospholipid transport system substrate-binding protein